MSYLRYCIVGKDSEFSFAPVDLGSDRFLLCDGLYDICDTPYHEEMLRVAMPQVFHEYSVHPVNGYGEYWNPTTGLLVEYQPGEEGYSPDPVKSTPTPLVGTPNLDAISHEVALDDYIDIMTDGEGYWSYDEDEHTDDLQHMKFRIQRIK